MFLSCATRTGSFTFYYTSCRITVFHSRETKKNLLLPLKAHPPTRSRAMQKPDFISDSNCWNDNADTTQAIAHGKHLAGKISDYIEATSDYLTLSYLLESLPTDSSVTALAFQNELSLSDDRKINTYAIAAGRYQSEQRKQAA